jgi:small subunit ribosomal protein S8
MVTDQIADLLTRIRNAQIAKHPTLRVPASKEKLRILKLLQVEGFIEKVSEEKSEAGKAELGVVLKYDRYGAPVINEIKRISSPGRRTYVGSENIPKVRGGLGVVLVSTSKGVLTDRDARKEGVGGELICSVY